MRASKVSLPPYCLSNTEVLAMTFGKSQTLQKVFVLLSAFTLCKTTRSQEILSNVFKRKYKLVDCARARRVVYQG